MPDKATPTHDLEAFKAAMLAPDTRLITGSATRDAASLGLNSEDMVAAVQTMQPSQFYKSMLSKQNPGYWQDVYHVPVNGTLMYVKITADPDMKLLSFKVK